MCVQELSEGGEYVYELGMTSIEHSIGLMRNEKFHVLDCNIVKTLRE